MKIILTFLLVLFLTIPYKTYEVKFENICADEVIVVSKTDDLSLIINKYARENDLDPLLIYSIIAVESNFNTRAVSKANCIGLMQINPRAHKKLLTKHGLTSKDLFNVDNNIKIGSMILRDYIKQHKSVEMGVKRYNGSKNMGYTNLVMKNYRNLKSNL